MVKRLGKKEGSESGDHVPTRSDGGGGGGSSRRTVRREKLPVKEDRKWSLEANDNWPGDRRTLDTPVARHVRKISTWS